MKKTFRFILVAISCLVLSVLLYSAYTTKEKEVKHFEMEEQRDSVEKFDTNLMVELRLDTIAFILAHRETGGTFNEKAVSKCGTYVGLLQMDCWWVDKANEYIGGKKYNHNDRYNGAKSIEIWKVHQYNRNEKIGLEHSIIEALETACIIHAGGKRNERVINYYKKLYTEICSNEIEYFDIKEKR